MSMTTGERKDIKRTNVGRSTGPKTQEGKDKSRRNALKHGLRAETLAVPGEDPAALAAREQEWIDHYKPQNPGEAYLIRTLIRSTIQLDRCDVYQTATLARQVRSAPDRWDQDQEHHVNTMVLLIDRDDRTDQVNAVNGFNRTAAGCRWLIGQWNELDGTLREKGYWIRNDYEWSIRLGGNCRGGELLIENPAFLDEPYRAPADPRRAAAYESTLAAIRAQVDELVPREAWLRVEIDVPDRAEAWKRALMIADPKQAQLFQRYQAAAHSTYLRSLAALNKAVKAREDAPDHEAPNEPSRADDLFASVCDEEISATEPGSEAGPPTAPGTVAGAAILVTTPARRPVETPIGPVRVEVGAFSAPDDPRNGPFPTS